MGYSNYSSAGSVIYPRLLDLPLVNIDASPNVYLACLPVLIHHPGSLRVELGMVRVESSASTHGSIYLTTRSATSYINK